MATGQPVWIGDPVARQAFPQILRLAHVEHDFSGIAHQIDAGMFGQLLKEFPAQPLHQRPGIRE